MFKYKIIVLLICISCGSKDNKEDASITSYQENINKRHKLSIDSFPQRRSLIKDTENITIFSVDNLEKTRSSLNHWFQINKNNDNPFPSGVFEEHANIFLSLYFQKSELYLGDGLPVDRQTTDANTLKNLVVSKTINFTNSISQGKEEVRSFISKYLDQHHKLPKKMILPLAGNRHMFSIVIENYENFINISVLEPLGKTSNFGWRGISSEIKDVLQERFPSYSIKIICTNKQNNNMRCGIHMMLNIVLASEIKGLAYDYVKNENILFGTRTKEDLLNFILKVRDVFFLPIKNATKITIDKV